MLGRAVRLACSFSKTGKIPRPRDPTVAQSFQTKLSEREIQILIDPKGFMSEEDKQHQALNALNSAQATHDKAEDIPAKVQVSEKSASTRVMEPEYGFKPRGPQPTRFGDWEIRGKCVDF